MIVLGIDPAIRTTGYGVIELTPSGKCKILDCGVISNSPRISHTECLRRLYGGIAELISLWHPDCAALEEPFVGKNSKTAIVNKCKYKFEIVANPVIIPNRIG